VNAAKERLSLFGVKRDEARLKAKIKKEKNTKTQKTAKERKRQKLPSMLYGQRD
jgi:hypothetical protein